jgi:colanic acid biosynthesis glycosyl transferase WcaI
MRFHPDLTGTGPLVTDLATSFAAMGDEVTVVTSMPHYGRKDISSEYRGCLLHCNQFEGVEVKRTFVYVPPNHKGFHRSLNYLSYNFMSVAAGMFSPRPDVIFCMNPPITVGFCGWLIGLTRRAPMVFNVQDIWPECIVIINQLRNPLLIRIFKRLEKFIYRVSSRVTVLSEGMKQNLLNKRVPEDKLVVIPNWVDVDHIQPLSSNNGFRSAHALDGKFVVMFAGNLGFIAVLDTVLDAATRLQDDDRIVFLIVGEGNAKSSLMERAESLGLSNVRFLTTQPKEILPEMLAAADISLVTLHSSLGQLNVPSKTYSIMASGRPVLASVPEDSEIARLIDEADCGVSVPPEDPQSLASAVKTLSKQPEVLERYGMNGRNYVVTHFDKSKVIGRYHELLNQVAYRKGSAHP